MACSWHIINGELLLSSKRRLVIVAITDILSLPQPVRISPPHLGVPGPEQG